MSNWGVNSEICDFNSDGVVDAADMAELLAKWGTYDLSPNMTNFNTVVNPVDSNNTKGRA